MAKKCECFFPAKIEKSLQYQWNSRIMDEIILLGMRAQINQRNETVGGLMCVLREMCIFLAEIDNIITQYVHGSPMRIDPEMADRFLNRTYFGVYEQISIRFEVVASDHCRTCFGNSRTVKFYRLSNGHPRSLIVPMNHVWNHMFSGYDSFVVAHIAVWMCDNEPSEPHKKMARCMLDDIRIQILAPDGKKM